MWTDEARIKSAEVRRLKALMHKRFSLGKKMGMYTQFPEAPKQDFGAFLKENYPKARTFSRKNDLKQAWLHDTLQFPQWDELEQKVNRWADKSRWEEQYVVPDDKERVELTATKWDAGRSDAQPSPDSKIMQNAANFWYKEFSGALVTHRMANHIISGDPDVFSTTARRAAGVLLRATHNSPPSKVALWRGLKMPSDKLKQFTVGSSHDLSLRSFTADLENGKYYASQKSPALEGVRTRKVLIQLQPGARALDLEVFTGHSEHVAGGRFEVTEVSTFEDHVLIKLKQVEAV